MPESEDIAPRRRVGLIIGAVLLALLCLNAWAQVFRSLVNWDDNPPLLVAWQTVSGAIACAAAIGAWRMRSWAPAATVLYGLVTGTMIGMLGSIIDLEPDARGGLALSALVVVCLSLGLAWAVRAPVRTTPPAPPDAATNY